MTADKVLAPPAGPYGPQPDNGPMWLAVIMTGLVVMWVDVPAFTLTVVVIGGFVALVKTSVGGPVTR